MGSPKKNGVKRVKASDCGIASWEESLRIISQSPIRVGGQALDVLISAWKRRRESILMPARQLESDHCPAALWAGLGCSA